MAAIKSSSILYLLGLTIYFFKFLNFFLLLIFLADVFNKFVGVLFFNSISRKQGSFLFQPILFI